MNEHVITFTIGDTITPGSGGYRKGNLGGGIKKCSCTPEACQKM